MFDKIGYYKKWNSEHREMKKIWAWNKRHSIENIKTQKPFIPLVIELPEHSTGSKRKCCWCGNNAGAGFCSLQCKSEYERLGIKNVEMITSEFADALGA